MASRADLIGSARRSASVLRWVPPCCTGLGLYRRHSRGALADLLESSIRLAPHSPASSLSPPRSPPAKQARSYAASTTRKVSAHGGGASRPYCHCHHVHRLGSWRREEGRTAEVTPGGSPTLLAPVPIYAHCLRTQSFGCASTPASQSPASPNDSASVFTTPASPAGCASAAAWHLFSPAAPGLAC